MGRERGIFMSLLYRGDIKSGNKHDFYWINFLVQADELIMDLP